MDYLLTSLRIRTRLDKVIILDTLLLWRYKMNYIISKSLLAGDKFMTELHLRHPWYMYSNCGPFTKNKVWCKVLLYYLFISCLQRHFMLKSEYRT